MHPARSNGLIWDLSGHEQSLSLCWVHGHMVYLHGQTLRNQSVERHVFRFFTEHFQKDLQKDLRRRVGSFDPICLQSFSSFSLLLSGDIVVLMATTWQWKWRFSRFRHVFELLPGVTNTAQARWGSSQYRSHPECCIRQVPALNAWQS